MAAARRITVRRGETVDAALWRETGAVSGGVEAVLAANPGLAAAGVVLDAPRRVLLPADAQTPAVAADTVQLWS